MGRLSVAIFPESNVSLSPIGKRIAAAVFVLTLAAGVVAVLVQKPTAPAVTFTTLNGKEIPLSALRGKVVLVNFWATSCPGCVQEMPELAQTYREYHRHGFEIVAVAMSYDPPQYVLNYTQKVNLPFLVALDRTGSIAKAFGNVQLTPTSFVIDKGGHVVQRTVGNMDFGKLHALIERELRANS